MLWWRWLWRLELPNMRWQRLYFPCSGCWQRWPDHLEVADCHDEVVSGREMIARPEEMARLLGWRAEGILSKVIRDCSLFISHESPASVTIMRVAGSVGGPSGYTQPLCIDTSHDGLQSHPDLRSFLKLYLSYNTYLWATRQFATSLASDDSNYLPFH